MSEGVLDLSGADTSGFDPIPSGRYNVRVHKVEMSATKGGPGAKMPANTPMVKIQLKVVDGEHEGRIVFDQFTLPAAGVENADKMLGFLVRFLTALGLDEAKLKSKGFKLTDLQDLVSKEAVATVVYQAETEQYAASNKVNGYKPAGSGTGGPSSASSGLI